MTSQSRRGRPQGDMPDVIASGWNAIALPKPKRRSIVLATLLVIVCVTVITLILKSRRHRFDSWIPFSDFTTTKLTDSGGVSHAAISPDGNYLIFAEQLPGRNWIIRLKTLSTSTFRTVISGRGSITSPFVFDVKGDRLILGLSPEHAAPDGECEVLEVSLKKGTTRQLRKLGCSSTTALSPDCRQLAFTSNDESGRGLIVISSIDGTNQRTIARMAAGAIAFLISTTLETF